MHLLQTSEAVSAKIRISQDVLTP